LLKDIITIFYSPLAQVYRAASIADSLGDLQNFINDLIRTVEQVEESRFWPSNGFLGAIILMRFVSDTERPQSYCPSVH